MAVTNDLVTDRRVLRHAAALREAGHEVVLLGRKEVPTRHSRGWRFYLEFNIALRRKLSEQNPDIVWANDTDTLPGCWMACRPRVHKAKLVMDAHEIFPEVPEIQRKPFVKWVWRTIERWMMPGCDALLTVCNSVAEYYRLRYAVSMTVVRNLPDNEECGMKKGEQTGEPDTSSFLIPHSSLKTLLYQGKVNLGRGVDWSIDALEWLPQCRLVVAGDGDLLEQMKAYAADKPWSDRVLFMGRMLPEDLERLTPQADVGLVMLENMGLNYYYAHPNRIGDFVQAGVPMVVSDLPEMAAVVRRFGVGEVIGRLHGTDEKAQARALARAVEKVLEKSRGGYDFTEARKDMDWNKEKNKLLECVNA